MTTTSVEERERIRLALRGRRLSVLARELGVAMPALEQFVSGGAGLAPALLTNLSRILARQPTPTTRRNATMKLSARSLKCTVMLNPTELIDPPGSAPR